MERHFGEHPIQSISFTFWISEHSRVERGMHVNYFLIISEVAEAIVQEIHHCDFMYSLIKFHYLQFANV